MEKYLIVRAIENIVLYIIVAVLFWFTRSPWVFLFLLFVNIDRRAKQRMSGYGVQQTGNPPAAMHPTGCNPAEELSDGFGSAVSVVCPECGNPSMQVVRPGSFRCSVCG